MMRPGLPFWRASEKKIQMSHSSYTALAPNHLKIIPNRLLSILCKPFKTVSPAIRPFSLLFRAKEGREKDFSIKHKPMMRVFIRRRNVSSDQNHDVRRWYTNRHNCLRLFLRALLWLNPEKQFSISIHEKQIFQSFTCEHAARAFPSFPVVRLPWISLYFLLNFLLRHMDVGGILASTLFKAVDLNVHCLSYSTFSFSHERFEIMLGIDSLPRINKWISEGWLRRVKEVHSTRKTEWLEIESSAQVVNCILALLSMLVTPLQWISHRAVLGKRPAGWWWILRFAGWWIVTVVGFCSIGKKPLIDISVAIWGGMGICISMRIDATRAILVNLCPDLE